MKLKFSNCLLFFCLLSLSIVTTSCGGDDDNSSNLWDLDKDKEEQGNKTEKPRYIWVDAAANFPDFADSKDNIRRDLTLAKEAGFTHIVVDVRPTSGDVLFKTTKADQVQWLGAWLPAGFTKITRTATWDYLQAFIEIGHELDLKIYAAINTFTGANLNSLGQNGMLYRDASKKEWATSLLTESGIISTLDENSSGSKFFNPVNENVQNFLWGLLEDLASYKDLDGIILDRGRFDELHSDFSTYTRRKFEDYLGYTIANFPGDVMDASTKAGSLPKTQPPYFKQWLEFRAKTIHDFMAKSREVVKSKNPDINFGVYVGGWYSTYYGVGVNWASPSYNTAADYSTWATAKYKNFGYADHMDIMLIGAYAPPTRVYGSTEWTVQGFTLKAKEKIKGDAIVVGGPDIGNGEWATASAAVVNQAITQSVDASINAGDGYFLFDMIHLKLKNQWQYVKTGIDSYLETVK